MHSLDEDCVLWRAITASSNDRSIVVRISTAYWRHQPCTVSLPSAARPPRYLSIDAHRVPNPRSTLLLVATSTPSTTAPRRPPIVEAVVGGRSVALGGRKQARYRWLYAGEDDAHGPAYGRVVPACGSVKSRNVVIVFASRYGETHVWQFAGPTELPRRQRSGQHYSA